MDKGLKKVTAYVLVAIVLLVTVVSILSIWDVIEFQIDFWKIITSLFVVFVASVIVLFIFSVILKDNKENP